jgi:hypothetical protein
MALDPTAGRASGRPKALSVVPRCPPNSWTGHGRMGSIMDRRLRRAPDTEWVLMYRLGLSRQRIAKLMRVHPALVGYYLVIAARTRDSRPLTTPPLLPKPAPPPDALPAWTRSSPGSGPRAGSPVTAPNTRRNGRWPGGSRSAGAKQPTAAFTRPAGTASRRSPGGPGRPRLADRKDPGPPIPAINAGPADSPLNGVRGIRLFEALQSPQLGEPGASTLESLTRAEASSYPR